MTRNYFTLKRCENIFFHIRTMPKYFVNICCNGRYTWSVGENIFTIFEEFIDFTTFEEFISKYFLAPLGYLMVAP